MSTTIRLGQTDSVNSVNRQNFLDVELKNTSKLSHFTDIKTTIDQYEQFVNERENCDKYRLILTINPYCSNVLFNTITEVVYAEGSTYCENVVGENKAENVNSRSGVVYGLPDPTRLQMIADTEYSKIGTAKRSEYEENYVYHPGYDIFNNHTLRNTTFKIVNKLKNSNEDTKKVFNTIADTMRYQDGSEVKFKRRDVFEVGDAQTKHLYLNEDVLTYEDSVNANLTEEDGWYGFINASTMQSKNPTDNFNDLGIAYTLNDRKPCEFIDMYPDRTLYSFTPKYNKYRHRLEHNWDIILTYPYEKTNEYDVVSFKDGNKRISSLTIVSATKTYGMSGEYVVLFRCLTKHGLKRGDTVRFYYDNNGWKTYEKDFIVKDVGDMNKEKKEYYFYITDMDFIRFVAGSTYANATDEELPQPIDMKYRFARVVNGEPCEYYIRKFKKLPNFKFRKENFSLDGYYGIDDIDSYKAYINRYVDENAKEDDKMVLFDHEQYKLGFASTIYNDDTTQVTFTDTIDVENLVDEFGRPLTEIYATIIKANRGHEEWYGGEVSNDKVEFSHCFGKVSCGLLFSQEYTDRSTKVIGEANDTCVLDYRTTYGDITCMYYEATNCIGGNAYDTDITVDNKDEFFGDIIEFTPSKVETRIIQPFSFRFNTRQRELNDINNYKLVYTEIETDDYDYTNETNKSSFKTKDITVTNQISLRPEGYYYQAHYRIPIREFGSVNQDSHYDIILSDISIVQADAIYIKLVAVRNAHLSVGDTLYMCIDSENKMYEFVVTYIENRVTYYVVPKCPANDSPWHYFTEKTWYDIVNDAKTRKKEDGTIVFRKVNENIPIYAQKVANNTYLWRDVLKPGDKDIVNLPEYAYANDSFYITNEINFFLKRQDPQGMNNLYCDDGFPNDISGNIKKESNYFYRKENEVVC